MVDGPRAQLASIEETLDAGTYRPGPWLRFIRAIAEEPLSSRLEFAPDVDRVSDKLHFRKTQRRFRWQRALLLESFAAVAGIALLAFATAQASAVLVTIAAIVLVTSLQPAMKVSIGLCLGFRYSYAYAWNGEPRFKLRYGVYLANSRVRRVLLHASGMLGGPTAWWLASVWARNATPRTSEVLGYLALGHLVYQVAILIAAALGLKEMWPYGAVRLTSPGAAGHEIRAALRPVAN